MKKYIFFVLLLSLITGCKSSKPLVSTSSDIQTVEQVQKDIVSSINETETEQSSRRETQTVDEEETTIIFRTDYDTDKPVDPITGKHPIKSETTTETTKNRKSETQSDENLTKNTESGSNTTDNSHINTDQKKKENTDEESPKDPYRYRYVFYIVATFTVLVAWFLKKRKI